MLTVLYTVLAIQAFIAAVLVLIWGILGNLEWDLTIQVVAILTFAGLFNLGVGQAASYLAQTAHFTSRICELLESLAIDFRNANESRSTSLDANFVSPSRGYFFKSDGRQQGPVSIADLKSMRKDGLIGDDTEVMREGESQWRRYVDCLALTRQSITHKLK